MESKTIEKYLTLLNTGKASELIFLRQIGKNIEVAKVWDKHPEISDNLNGNFFSYRFFFIKDECNTYVGAVLDMHHDLHWYVSPEYRGKGYLTKALKSGILPYLFEFGRDLQTITINDVELEDSDYLSSKKVALNVGFRTTNENETQFGLNCDDFDWNAENLDEIDGEISPERIDELRKKLFFAYKILYQISDELLMAVDDDKGLLELAKKINSFTWKIIELESWKR